MVSEGLDDLAYEFVREGWRPFNLTPTTMRVEAGFPDRPDNWLISVEDGSWRLQHETGLKEDLTFPSREAAMHYLRPRLSEPLLP